MLLGSQTKPGGELPSGAELIGIGDRGGNGCCGDNAQARDRGKPATGLIIGMPGGKLLVQHRDLAADGHDLANQYLQRPPGIGL